MLSVEFSKEQSARRVLLSLRDLLREGYILPRHHEKSRQNGNKSFFLRQQRIMEGDIFSHSHKIGQISFNENAGLSDILIEI
jgi:hypothetical protein